MITDIDYIKAVNSIGLFLKKSTSYHNRKCKEFYTKSTKQLKES